MNINFDELIFFYIKLVFGVTAFRKIEEIVHFRTPNLYRFPLSFMFGFFETSDRVIIFFLLGDTTKQLTLILKFAVRNGALKYNDVT